MDATATYSVGPDQEGCVRSRSRRACHAVQHTPATAKVRLAEADTFDAGLRQSKLDEVPVAAARSCYGTVGIGTVES